MRKKIVLGLLIISFLAGGMTYPMKAKAFLGIADITINPEGVVGWITDVTFKTLDLAMRAALEMLKKRLLDEIVDGIIQWIQGDGKPKFVEDFSGTVKEAANAAVGDFVEQLPLAPICEPFKARLQFDLAAPPRFSQKASCTLNEIVNNFEDFYNDFQTGGWIGYSESLKPQNNYLGTLIMTFEEVNTRIEEAEEARQQEINVGGGFLSLKQCLEWTLVDLSGQEDKMVFPVTESFDYNDPSEPPPLEPPYVPDYGDEFEGPLIYNYKWQCTKDRVTTPGTAIAEGLNKSLYADLDFLANAQDLSAYIGAILDAAINRLIKEGVKGVQSLKPSGESPPGTCDDLKTQAARDACRDYQSRREEAKETARNASEELASQQAELALQVSRNAEKAIADAISLNRELLAKTQELITCQGSRNLNCVQNPDLAAINDRIAQLENDKTNAESLAGQIEQLRREILDPDTPEFEKKIKQKLIQVLANQLEEIQRNAEQKGDQAQSDLERIKSELQNCQNFAQSYICPA